MGNNTPKGTGVLPPTRRGKSKQKGKKDSFFMSNRRWSGKKGDGEGTRCLWGEKAGTCHLRIRHRGRGRGQKGNRKIDVLWAK